MKRAVFKDIQYTTAYNPEQMSHKRDVKYIIDGSGKEKLLIEEINEDKENGKK